MQYIYFSYPDFCISENDPQRCILTATNPNVAYASAVLETPEIEIDPDEDWILIFSFLGKINLSFPGYSQELSQETDTFMKVFLSWPTNARKMYISAMSEYVQLGEIRLLINTSCEMNGTGKYIYETAMTNFI